MGDFAYLELGCFREVSREVDQAKSAQALRGASDCALTWDVGVLRGHVEWRMDEC